MRTQVREYGPAAGPELSPDMLDQVNSNMGLADTSVIRVSARLGGLPPDVLSDSRQDAFLGLMDAARLFDPNIGVPFAKYAPRRTEGEVIDGMRRRERLAGPDRKEARVVSQLNNTNARSLDAPHSPGAAFSHHDVLPDDQPTTEEFVQTQLDLEKIYEMLGSSLSERQVIVFAMRSRKVRVREIAEFLGVSEKTVSRDFKEVVKFVLSHELSDFV